MEHGRRRTVRRFSISSSPFLFSTLYFCAQISYAAGVSKPADFVGWVTDPARTNDELFTVELLIDRMRVWQHWPFRERSLGFDEAQKVKKERRFNPAYRPFLALDELEALQNVPIPLPTSAAPA